MDNEIIKLVTPGVRGLQPYIPGKPVEELERDYGVKNAIKLASNENPLGASPKALAAAQAALSEIARYPDGGGFALKSALAAKLGVQASQITLGNGSNDILEFVTRSFVTPQDEVIFSQHAFAVYPIVTQAIGAKAVEVPARQWGHDLNAMRAAITARSRLVFIANPNNPTGTWLSSAAQTLLGHQPDELTGTCMEAWMPREDAARFHGEYARLLAGETDQIRIRYRFRHGTGKWVPLEAHGRLVRVEDRPELLLVARDINEQTQLEHSLAAARAEAEAANHAKSEFLARMSHELRTPLNAVIGFANVLLRNKDGTFRERDLTFLDRIQKAGVHLLGLINGLLDLAKIESGKLQVEASLTDVRALIDEIVAQFEVQAEAKGVEFVVAYPAGPIQPVTTDRAKLAQVLLNLVANALKFTSHGRVTVQVTASEQGVPESISVTDSGIGIPANRLDAIFEAFEQADRTTEAIYGGTGLGLPISRALCEMLGYRLDVQSTVGVGSTFTVDMRPQLPPQAR